MEDLIRRQDAANLLYKMLADDYVDGYAYLEQLRALPSAEPERKKGKWVVHDYALGRERYECAECRGRCDLEYNFCPHCGAEMSGGER